MTDDLNNYLDYSPFYAGFDVEKDYIRKTFLDNYINLPQILRDFMVSEDTASKIYNLGSDNDLNKSQIIIMSAMLRYVLIGDIYIKDMPKLLISSISIGEQGANVIFESLVNQILSPVWDDIKKIQIAKFGNEPSSSQQTPINPPSFHEQNMTAPPRQNYPGENLPETGGNIIDLRS